MSQVSAPVIRFLCLVCVFHFESKWRRKQTFYGKGKPFAIVSSRIVFHIYSVCPKHNSCYVNHSYLNTYLLFTFGHMLAFSLYQTALHNLTRGKSKTLKWRAEIPLTGCKITEKKIRIIKEVCSDQKTSWQLDRFFQRLLSTRHQWAHIVTFSMFSPK